MSKLLLALATISIVGSSAFSFIYLWTNNERTSEVSAIEPESSSHDLNEPEVFKLEDSSMSTEQSSRTHELNDASDRDPWRDGVEHATKAAELAQTANNRSEWDIVAITWNTASSNMANVPNTHPNYAIAQQKVEEYKTNQQIANERAMETR